MVKVAVIVVTHNSKPVIGKCISAVLAQQNVSCEVIIVDSGSTDTAYLDLYQNNPKVQLVLSENVGFAKANNQGYRRISSDSSDVVFLNPDAFLEPDSLSKALKTMAASPDIACLTGRMSGYDLKTDQANGLLDSTGVFRKWYGRWYDRSHGEMDLGQYRTGQDLPAACGAFMLCKKAALTGILLNGQDVFDPDFFLFKEDIELSLRLQKNGGRIFYDPEVKLYHCRGWNQTRSQVAYPHRLLSAQNEILLYRKHKSLYCIWAFLKYMLVRLFHI